MFENQAMVAGMQGAAVGAGTLHDPTIRENIDGKIAQLQEQIAELEALKTQFPEEMLAMKIGTLRFALYL